MNYKVYKFDFHAAVHFGKNSLENAEYTFGADTLFSALCQEALKKDKEVLNQLYHYASTGQLLLSDAFPFMGDIYFLPKPMLHINTADKSGDSSVKKAYKKLKYIPAEDLSDYLNGKYDVLHAPDLNNELGSFDMKVSAAIRGEEETTPYRVETYYFNEKNGLYIIVGYTDEGIVTFIEELLEQLSFSGIGGKRVSGMGRFTLDFGKISDDLQKRLKSTGSRYMVLSMSLPREEEIQRVLEQAEYLLCKRSGFVSSDTYAAEQMRKRDLYVLKTGSCVQQKYEGDIYDVSDKGGKHPVYRYAKPLFMEVKE